MSVKTLLFIFIGFFIFTAGMVYLLSIAQKPVPNAKFFAISDSDRPKIETTNTSFDFGEIKVSDVKQQDFTFKNSGSKDLQILNIDSSCNCTFGQVLYKDFVSKEYGMHAQSGYVTQISPSDTASIRVTYKPAIMPVFGLVEREVYVMTNDPANPRLIFSVTAKVK